MGDGQTELNEFEQCLEDVAEIVNRLNALKVDDRFRCRSLSVAVTELETGEMWLHRALSDLDQGIRT